MICICFIFWRETTTPYLTESSHLASFKCSLCINTNWKMWQNTQQVIRTEDYATSTCQTYDMFSLKYKPKTSYFCQPVYSYKRPYSQSENTRPKCWCFDSFQLNIIYLIIKQGEHCYIWWGQFDGNNMGTKKFYSEKGINWVPCHMLCWKRVKCIRSPVQAFTAQQKLS